MPVDTSIYSGLLQPPQSPLAYANQFGQAQQNQLQLATQRQQFAQSQQTIADTNNLRAAIGSGLDLSTPEGAAKAISIAPTVAPALLKTYQDSATSRALAAKDTATADSTNWQTQVAKANKAISDISALTSPQDALTSAQQHLASGDIDQPRYQAIVSSLQPVLQGQAPFGQWQRQMVMGIMDAKDRIAATAPKVEMANTGGALVPVNTNADAGPVGQVPGSAPLKTTVSPDAALQARTSAGNAALERKTQLQINGFDPNGNMIDLGLGAPGAAAPGTPGAPGGPPGPPAPTAAASPFAGLVDTIGQYKTPESVALQRVPPAIKSQVMAAVQAKYPDYDPMTYTERQSTIHSFAPNGNNGKTVQAMNVAVDHLGKMQTLADALNNGDNQTFNAVGNAISAWTGSPAPTNFASAKNIVMDEVTKGVLGSAGGEGDRDKMAATVARANSPAQLSGAIKTITSLMAGRLQGVAQSYRIGTGRSDFNKYLEPAAQAALEGAATTQGAALPFSTDAIAAELAKRAGGQ